MSQPLKGLFIGAGFFSRNHLHAWAEVRGAEITAICDRDPARAEAAAKEFGIGEWHTDAAVLHSGRFDFVDICTTMETHEELVALAVAARVPVIVQKPFAPDIATCLRIEAGARAAGVPVMLHENFRFQKIFRRLREILDAGEIGEVTFGRLNWRNDIDVYTNQPYLLKTERFMIMDVGIHMLDLARFLLGDAHAVSCFNQSVKEGLAGEDAATLMLRHDNRAVSVVDISYATHKTPNTFPQTLGEIEGRLGTVQILDGQVLRIHSPAGLRDEVIAPDQRSWTSAPWTQIQDSVPRTQQHFIDALRAGTAFETSARDSLQTYALAEAAYRSAASGAVVKTADLLKDI
ncbi:Gfo/Idh/MocA family oxidoreductase [Xinfangfangia sp. D13-10-4-6]|uniref:Gfo/Idh/MocA family protein n=1 Tax=Pseudogemmobacter hezensis TaxID=2737662 RepID=UPI0015556A25|nr:Gfo/Idh/MocA family oxidoreductase [Pseudogemmobacter hezensis]NPD16842.1 Gfo/Idh/MocA family oxidoreductase [Pseudogemmobacter hezensis]